MTTWIRGVEAPTPRRLIVMSLVFAFGVFTHVGVLLAAAPLGLLTLGRYGRTLLHERRDFAWALASFGLPLLLFFAGNTLTGASSSGAHGGISFIGDHTLSWDSVLHP